MQCFSTLRKTVEHRFEGAAIAQTTGKGTARYPLRTLICCALNGLARIADRSALRRDIIGSAGTPEAQLYYLILAIEH